MATGMQVEYGNPADSAMDIFGKMSRNISRANRAMFSYVQSHKIPNSPAVLHTIEGTIIFTEEDCMPTILRKRKTAA